MSPHYIGYSVLAHLALDTNSKQLVGNKWCFDKDIAES